MMPIARFTIETGFTAVRDLGSRFEGSHDFVDVGRRHASATGIIVGPQMLGATCGIGGTGGHFDDTTGCR